MSEKNVERERKRKTGRGGGRKFSEDFEKKNAREQELDLLGSCVAPREAYSTLIFSHTFLSS